MLFGMISKICVKGLYRLNFLSDRSSFYRTSLSKEEEKWNRIEKNILNVLFLSIDFFLYPMENINKAEFFWWFQEVLIEISGM